MRPNDDLQRPYVAAEVIARIHFLSKDWLLGLLEAKRHLRNILSALRQPTKYLIQTLERLLLLRTIHPQGGIASIFGFYHGGEELVPREIGDKDVRIGGRHLYVKQRFCVHL